MSRRKQGKPQHLSKRDFSRKYSPLTLTLFPQVEDRTRSGSGLTQSGAVRKKPDAPSQKFVLVLLHVSQLSPRVLSAALPPRSSSSFACLCVKPSPLCFLWINFGLFFTHKWNLKRLFLTQTLNSMTRLLWFSVFIAQVSNRTVLCVSLYKFTFHCSLRQTRVIFTRFLRTALTPHQCPFSVIEQCVMCSKIILCSEMALKGLSEKKIHALVLIKFI